MARKFVPKIATANDLLDGDVVYFDGQSWRRDFDAAEPAASAESAERLLAAAQSRGEGVVGIYLADIEMDAAGQISPAHFREVFRRKGPSNRPEHGRAAGGA